MKIRLHAYAAATPKTRAYIQSSDKSIGALAGEPGVSVSTVRHWRNRDTIDNGSHTRKNLLVTLSSSQGVIAIDLRHTLLLPLGDLLTVVHEFIHPSRPPSLGAGSLRAVQWCLPAGRPAPGRAVRCGQNEAA